MISTALILLGAAIAVAVTFHSFKLPPIVAYISAGILIGPSALGLISTSPQVYNVTEISAVLLMFTIGLEFSFRDLAKFGRPLVVLGLGQVLLTLLIFIALFYFGLSFTIQKSIFLAFLIVPSSTAVVLKLLQDHREFETPYGRASFSVLLMQDMAVIPMILVIPFLVSQKANADSFLDSLFPLLLLILLALALIYLASRYALPFLFHRVSRTQNREIFFFTVLFVCVGAAALMHKIGLSVSLGAFIAGMLLAGSDYSKQATAEILPLRDTFLSLFFVAVGMMLDVHFLATHALEIFGLGLGVFLMKSAILFFLVWLAGNSAGISRAVTGLLFQFGEFSFILAELGRGHSLISEQESQYFVAIGITSLALTPLLYKKLPFLLNSLFWSKLLPTAFQQRAERFRNAFRRTLTPDGRGADMSELTGEKGLADHVIVIGFGVAGQSLCRVLKHLNLPFKIIELNAETVRVHSRQMPILFGDAAHVEILKSANIEQARLVVALTSGVSMLEPILRSIHQLRPEMPVIARTHYLTDLERLRSHPQTYFVVSESETTLKAIDLTLKSFHIEPAMVDGLINELRQALYSVAPEPTFS